MTNQKPHIVRPQKESLISNVKKAIAQPGDFPVMFYVWGIGGVGKTTLLERLQENLDSHFKEINQKIHFTKYSFSAVDETPLGVMEKLHRELPLLGILQKDLFGKSDPFADTLKRYKSTLNDLETKPIDDKKTVEKEQIDQVKQLSKLLANAGLWAGQTALSGGMSTPFSLLANSTASAVVNNAVDATIDGVTMALSLKDSLLLKHQATKQSQELRDLMLEPLPKLTQAFVESLVRHAKHIPVALILDTYEKASADVDTWLRQFLLTNKALKDSKVRLVVAGRYHLFRKDSWKELISRSKLVQESSLKEFEDKQTKSYLEQIGFSDKREVDKLWKTTKGLPFHLDLIRQEKQDEELINFTEEISDRLLKGLTEQQKRLVQLAACCRWFHRSLLESLVHCQDLEFTTSVDPHRNCFEWLKGFDIVEPVKDDDGKYCLKDVARDVIRKSLFNDNRIKFREIHSLLQKYFEDEANREVPQECCESEKYTNPDWSRYTSEAIYHAFFNLSREEGKRYFLTHFFASRFFGQIEVVSIPFFAITSEFEISDNKLLPHENQKFLKSLESLNQYFFIVWFMIDSQPTNAIKIDEIQLSQVEIERIENTIKIFSGLAEYLPDSLAKYMGLASKFLRCRPFQKVELLKHLEVQAKFLKNKINSEFSSQIFDFVGAGFGIEGRYEESITDLDEAIKLKPDFSNALSNRGAGKVELGRYEEALIDCEEAIKIEPDFPYALSNRGAAKNGLRRYEEAIIDFDEAIKLKPDFPNALSNRGNAKVELGRYEEAIADLDEAIKLKPDFHSVWFNRGNAKNGLRRYEEAIIDFDEAIKLKSDFPNVWFYRGVVKNGLGRYEEAIADFDEVIKLKPDFPNVWFNRGNAKNGLGRYEEAIADLDEAIKLKPDFHSVWFNRGNAKNGLGRYEEAIADLDEAIKLKPDFPEAWVNRGAAKLNLEMNEEAIGDLDEAIKLKPDFPEAWVNRGAAKLNLEMNEEAIGDLDEAIKLKPDFHSVWFNRGNAKNGLGRYEEAIADLDEAIKLKPDFPEAWVNRGAAKLNLEMNEEAIGDLDEAIKLKLDFPEAWNHRGIAKNVLGRYEEAIADLDQVIKLKPDFPEAWNHRGIALTRIGKYDKALHDFNKAVQLAPNDLQCKINRGVLFAWMGRYEDGIEVCDAVLQNNSHDLAALYGKSCCYALQNNIEDSVKYLALAIAQEPDDTKKRAKQDPEFNGIRDESRFQELVNG